jgi:hypothetical protein
MDGLAGEGNPSSGGWNGPANRDRRLGSSDLRVGTFGTPGAGPRDLRVGRPSRRKQPIGWFWLVDREAVVAMPPGGEKTVKRPNRVRCVLDACLRMQIYKCTAFGIGRPSGRTVKGSVDWRLAGLRIGRVTNGGAGIREACRSSEMRGSQGPLDGWLGLRAGLDIRQPGWCVFARNLWVKSQGAAERGS